MWLNDLSFKFFFVCLFVFNYIYIKIDLKCLSENDFYWENKIGIVTDFIFKSFEISKSTYRI